MNVYKIDINKDPETRPIRVKISFDVGFNVGLHGTTVVRRRPVT